MKIPLIWLKDYISIKKTPQELADAFTALGLMLDKPIQNDVLDLEHRMDRSDWLSIMGCARDLAAFEGLELKYPKIYTKPGKSPSRDQLVDIKVECPDIVRRFNTRVFRNITVKESPEWIKERLESYGIPSINNIVDITNFVMVEMGQPMHAQDLAKMEKKEIVIRRAEKGEKLTTLLGQEIELTPNCFVLTQNGKATVLGGIVGTAKTAVDKNTTDIILDAGNYDQVNIRQNSRYLKIQNETVLRYDKFLHPKLTEIALDRATELILELAGGEYYQNIDFYPQPHEAKKMHLRYSRLKQISGMELGKTKPEMILRSLEYKIIKTSEEGLEVEVPYFRTDIEVEDDLVADILRINNYKNIPFALLDMAPPKEITPAIYNFENKLREIMANLRLNEHVTDPFVPADSSHVDQVLVENALSPDKSALRINLRDTLYPILNTYKKHKINRLGIFEIGEVYNKIGQGSGLKKYQEQRVVQVILMDETKTALEISKSAKKLLSAILFNLGIQDVRYTIDGSRALISHRGTDLGYFDYESITLYTPQLLKASQLPNKNSITTRIPNYRTEDISITMNVEQKFGELFDFIKDCEKDIVGVEVIEEFLEPNQAENKKSVLVRITYQEKFADYKTQLIQKLEQRFGVVVKR